MILSNMDMKAIKKKEAHRSCFKPFLSLCPNLIEKSAPLPNVDPVSRTLNKKALKND